MTEHPDRDGRGRFAPGNPGGPGRPRRKVERDYLGRMSDAVSLDDWQRITERAVQDALDGDGAARAWLSRHLLPIPGVKHEPLHRIAADDLPPHPSSALIPTLPHVAPSRRLRRSPCSPLPRAGGAGGGGERRQGEILRFPTPECMEKQSCAR